MRRIFLFVALSIGALLVWQNWQVSFQIAFLFWRTPVYPLGLLILAGLGLGCLLGLIVTLLWSIGQSGGVKTDPSPRREPRRPPPPEPEPEIDDWFTEPTSSPRRESWSEARNVTPPEDQLPHPQETDFIAETLDTEIPDIKIPEPESIPTGPPPRPERNPRRPRPNVRQEVVDAEFRVLTPPYNAIQPTPAPSNEQDWGDWLEDEGQR